MSWFKRSEHKPPFPKERVYVMRRDGDPVSAPKTSWGSYMDDVLEEQKKDHDESRRAEERKADERKFRAQRELEREAERKKPKDKRPIAFSLGKSSASVYEPVARVAWR